MASQAEFDAASHAAMRAIRAASGRLTPGGSASDWVDEFNAALLDGHAEAWTMGRQLGGDLAPRGYDDTLMGRAKADLENEWLQQFMADIEDGRYTKEDGSLDLDAIDRRSKLYVRKMRGTSNEALVETSDPEVEWNWVLGPTDHCADCPQYAALSPYTRDTAMAHPGDGGSDCLGNCTCRWVRADGQVAGFERVEDL